MTGEALRAEEVEELLRSVEEAVLAILTPFRVDEEEATELVLDILRTLACAQGGTGDLRARFLEALGRAVYTRWAVKDPLEDADVVH